MKLIPKSLYGLLLAVSLTGTLARATDVPPQGVIKHTIVVIMENRTPDNLFYGDQVLYEKGYPHVSAEDRNYLGACFVDDASGFRGLKFQNPARLRQRQRRIGT